MHLKPQKELKFFWQVVYESDKYKTTVRSENNRFYAFKTTERVKVFLTSCISKKINTKLQ